MQSHFEQSLMQPFQMSGEELHVQAEKTWNTCRGAGDKLSFHPAKIVRLQSMEMQP